MDKDKLSYEDTRRFTNGTYTREEAERIFHRLQNYDGDYEEVLSDSMNDVWNTSADISVNTFQEDRYRYEAYVLLKQINRKPLPVARYVRLAVAASVLVLLSVGFGTYKHFYRTESVYANVQTSFGEMRTLELPDGTKIMLNACSKIRYPQQFKGSMRQVELEGEAWFQVAKNEKQPFLVNTERFDVRVLGTEFNVKAYAGDEVQAVNVATGKVQVETPDASMKLVTAEQFRIDAKTGEYNKIREEQAVAVWRNGSLRFDKAPLRDVANELERVYHCKIEFKERQMFDNLISGEHNNKSLEAVLKSLEYTSGVHFRFVEKDKVVLFK